MQQYFRDAFQQLGITDPVALSLADRLATLQGPVAKTADLQLSQHIEHSAKGMHPETLKLLAESRAHELASVRPSELALHDPNDQLQALAKHESYTRFGTAIGGTWKIFDGWRQQYPSKLLGKLPGHPAMPLQPMLDTEDDILQTVPAESVSVCTAQLKFMTKMMMDHCIKTYCATDEGKKLSIEMAGIRKIMGNPRDMEMSISGGMGTAIKFIFNTHVLALEHLVRQRGAAGVTPGLWRQAIDANGTYIALLAARTNLKTLAGFDTLITRTDDPMLETTMDRYGFLQLRSGEKVDRDANLRFYSLFRPERFRFADDALHLDIDPGAFSPDARKTLLSQSSYTYGCPAMDEGVVMDMYCWLSEVTKRYAMPFTRQHAEEIAGRMAGMR